MKQVTPDLPPGRMVRLGNRGETFVRDAAGPLGSIPVILLHGWTWTADFNYFSVYGPLSAQHRVIACDIRMHGRATRDGGFTLIDAGDDVIALLDELGIERAILCGYSMGGGIAADVVNRYPDRVAGTVVCATAACYTTLLRDRMIFAALRALQPLVTLGIDPQLGARAVGLLRWTNRALASRWEWARAELVSTSLADVINVTRHIPTVDIRLRAHNDARPCEYLLLTRDKVCRPQLQRELAEFLDARITPIDADHDLPVSDPTRYAGLVVDAVARLAGRITIEHRDRAV